jgi:hypothetical protein
MSLQSIADVIAHVQDHPDVPPTQVLVLLVIANYADQHGANAYPTLDTIKKTTHLARRTIRYALRGLEQDSLIDTGLIRGRSGRQTYRLLVPHTPLKKGATDAPIPEKKGATDAPIAEIKGASDDTKKGQQMPLELLLNQQKKKKERAHAQDEGNTMAWNADDLATKARKVGVLPGSPLWSVMTGLHGNDDREDSTHDVSPWADGPRLGTGVGVWVILRPDGNFWGSIPRSALCVAIPPS